MSDLSKPPTDVAAERGLVLVLPGEHELLIDADDLVSSDWMGAMMGVLISNGEEIAITKSTTSASGNTHFYLSVPKMELTPLLRVALQACLGSDRKRELLSLLRIIRNYDMPATCFFERPNDPAADALIHRDEVVL